MSVRLQSKPVLVRPVGVCLLEHLQGGRGTIILERETLDRLYRYCYSLTGNEDDDYSLLQDGVER